MMKNSSRYKQGDLIVLELPFTNLLGSKLRPVLVLNAIDLGDDIIVAKIISSSGPHRIPITQLDLAMGRLKKEPKLYRLFKHFYSREEVSCEGRRRAC